MSLNQLQNFIFQSVLQLGSNTHRKVEFSRSIFYKSKKYYLREAFGNRCWPRGYKLDTDERNVAAVKLDFGVYDKNPRLPTKTNNPRTLEVVFAGRTTTPGPHSIQFQSSVKHYFSCKIKKASENYEEQWWARRLTWDLSTNISGN